MIVDTFLIYSKFILILISSLNISYYFKEDFYKINLLLISILVFFLLYFSFFGFFRIGNILIHIFLILNLLLFIFNSQKILNFKFFLIPISILVLSEILSPNEFLFWDEFTQWGIKPKEIFINQSIFIDNITTNNKYWTLSLYHNIILFGLKSFSEKAIILSQIFINISGILFIYSFFKKKNIYNLILLFIFFYFCSSIFSYGYFTIYLDILVFLYFTCLFFLIFENNFKDWKNVFIVIVLLSFLFLIKGISIFFGFLTILYLFLIYFLKKIEFKKIITIISIVSVIFISYQYLVYSNNYGFHVKPDIQYYAPKIDSGLLNNYFFSALGSNNIYEGKFMNLFWKIFEQLKLDNPNFYFLNFKFNYYFWISFLLIISLMILNYDNSNQYILTLAIIFSSLIIYSIFIYFSYKHYFGPAEAASMSSFGRYFGIYFIFWFFVIFIKILNLKSNKIFPIYSKWFLLILIVFSAPGKAYENIFSVVNDFEQSQQSKILKKKADIKNLSFLIPKNKKVLFIDQNQDEFYLRVARFITYPIKSNEICSSIVKKKENQKQYDCLINKIEFDELLKEYDFIFFLNSNIELIENYHLKNRLKKVHVINELSLYKILKI